MKITAVYKNSDNHLSQVKKRRATALIDVGPALHNNEASSMHTLKTKNGMIHKIVTH